MGRRVVLAGCLIVAMLACLGGAAATQYVMGGSQGWTALPNITVGYYDEWAAGIPFTGGDTSKFVWNETHNVANVSEECDSCTKVSSVFQGGDAFSYTLPADSNGLYYFICTVNAHCENRQKLAITVVNPTPLPSAHYLC